MNLSLYLGILSFFILPNVSDKLANFFKVKIYLHFKLMSDNKITLDALAVEEKKVEIEQERDEWRLCCSKSSASLIRYIGQMVCCASVLTF